MLRVVSEIICLQFDGFSWMTIGFLTAMPYILNSLCNVTHTIIIYRMKIPTGPANCSKSSESLTMYGSHKRKFSSFQKALFSTSHLFFFFFFFSATVSSPLEFFTCYIKWKHWCCLCSWRKLYMLQLVISLFKSHFKWTVKSQMLFTNVPQIKFILFNTFK